MIEAWRRHPTLGPFLMIAEAVIRRAWSRETTAKEYKRDWSEENPALGQCAVSAALLYTWLREYAGIAAEIVFTRVPGLGNHYWVRLPDGTEIDLTRSQFTPGVVVPPGIPTDFMRHLKNHRKHLRDFCDRLDLLTERAARYARELEVLRRWTRPT